MMKSVWNTLVKIIVDQRHYDRNAKQTMSFFAVNKCLFLLFCTKPPKTVFEKKEFDISPDTLLKGVDNNRGKWLTMQNLKSGEIKTNSEKEKSCAFFIIISHVSP